MDMPEYDVVVIGGGPAGYMAAIKAATLGGRTALVEKDELGGTCLNRGCIPTKTYLKSAEIIHELKDAAGRGIMINDPAAVMDMVRAVEAKQKIVKKLTKGVGQLLAANVVTVIRGEGRLLSPSEIEIPGTGLIKARRIILAGGSKVLKIPVDGVDSPGVITSDDILDICEVPARLAIVGGGVVGLEMAMIFHSFGSKVMIIEAADRILPFMDSEVSEAMHSILKSRGVDILTETSLARIVPGEGFLSLHSDHKELLKADKVLLSAGREADLSCTGNVPVAQEKGKILTDRAMETSIPGVYAPGDLNGRKMLAHAAYKMGEIAAENAMAEPSQKKREMDFRYVPSVVYTFPEAAGVGLTEEEAEKRGYFLTGKFPLSANGRALSSGSPEGFVKVLAEPGYGRILGVHIVGSGASEIINEAAALMAMEVTVHELSDIIHGHPTISEALMEAAADCLDQCLHLPPKQAPKQARKIAL